MPDRRGVPIRFAPIWALERLRSASPSIGNAPNFFALNCLSAQMPRFSYQNGIHLESGSGKALFERFCKASNRGGVPRMAALTLGKYHKVINRHKFGDRA